MNDHDTAGDDAQPERLFKEIRERLARLSANLPVAVDASTLAPRSKTPYVLLCVREAQTWRAEEFARTACEAFERGDVVVGVTNTRSVVESVAATWYVKRLVDHACANGVPEDLHKRAVCLSVGHRNDPELPSAINVLTMIQKVDLDLPGFVNRYDRMSEFAHPNWSGAFGAYAKTDQATRITRFGKNPRGNQYPIELGLSCLAGALLVLEAAHAHINNQMTAFCEACEKALTDAA